jgi:peptidoglycan/xylan/chitin deacetylase (PgdA/CDA1 family)
MYLPKTLFSIASIVALSLASVSAQDVNPKFITKCVAPGTVALTFDDGPSPAFTPKLLGHLAKAKVFATFYVLGVNVVAPGGADTLKATFDAGHTIALHSNTHADMNTKTPAQVEEEFLTNIKAVETVIGKKPAIARPPLGNCNEACAKVMDKLGLTITQWNCDSNDWRYDGVAADQPKTLSNIAAIINPSNPKTDSFITLQHDIKGYSVDYVPQIIELIAAKGYKFVTIEECLGGKIPAYSNGGGGAPAPAANPAPAPAAAPATAPYAQEPSPSVVPGTNSASKLTSSTFGLTLIGLALSLLY